MYVQKKHKIYSELYKKLQIVDGGISSFQGIKVSPSFEEFNKADMEKYLIRKGVLESYATKLLSQFESDREYSIKEIRDYLDLLNYNKIGSSLHDAKNYYLIQELYLSDDLSREVLDLIKVFGKLYVDYDPQFRDLLREKSKRLLVDEEKKTCDTKIENIKRLMKSELSIGSIKNVAR